MHPDPVQSHVPNFLEVAHVAHRLKVSQEFVRRLIRANKLAAVRLEKRWRVREDDLKAYLDARLWPAADRRQEG